MNVDSFVSFLTQSTWVFLTGLILLLGIAFADTFSEKPGKKHSSDSRRAKPR
jgi:uncharacterized BrkB/YihY/UPF0761 family membrane protein